MGENSAVSGSIGQLLLIGAYLLPTIVASVRRHANEGAIFILNLLLGWTIVGWIAALIWAATSNVRDKPIRLERRRRDELPPDYEQERDPRL